jgi:hypothetical protein
VYVLGGIASEEAFGLADVWIAPVRKRYEWDRSVLLLMSGAGTTYLFATPVFATRLQLKSLTIGFSIRAAGGKVRIHDDATTYFEWPADPSARNPGSIHLKVPVAVGEGDAIQVTTEGDIGVTLAASRGLWN